MLNLLFTGVSGIYCSKTSLAIIISFISFVVVTKKTVTLQAKHQEQLNLHQPSTTATVVKDTMWKTIV